MIGRILLPERCANVCFGGKKRNRLFMAASQSIYALYVETQGVLGGGPLSRLVVLATPHPAWRERVPALRHFCKRTSHLASLCCQICSWPSPSGEGWRGFLG